MAAIFSHSAGLKPVSVAIRARTSASGKCLAVALATVCTLRSQRFCRS